MRKISDHHGAVVSVKHANGYRPLIVRSSDVTLLDGAVHRFTEYGLHRQITCRELDHFVDVSKAKRVLVLWVQKEHSQWKVGENFVCLGRLWIQTTPKKKDYL